MAPFGCLDGLVSDERYRHGRRLSIFKGKNKSNNKKKKKWLWKGEMKLGKSFFLGMAQQEFQVSESPLVLTLIDSGNCYSAGGQGENQICVGYRHQFDLINERTSETKRFYNVEGKWAHLVAAIDVYEDEEPELLLCFNSNFDIDI